MREGHELGLTVEPQSPIWLSLKPVLRIPLPPKWERVHFRAAGAGRWRWRVGVWRWFHLPWPPSSLPAALAVMSGAPASGRRDGSQGGITCIALEIRDLYSNILPFWEQMLFCGHLALRFASLHTAVPSGAPLLPLWVVLVGWENPDACLPLWKPVDHILPTMLSKSDTAIRFSPRTLNSGQHKDIF